MLPPGNTDDRRTKNLIVQTNLYSPAYNGLTNNVATRLMKTKLHEWPEGTEDYVNHKILEEYIQALAKKTGVENSTIFGAKVTTLEKEGKAWNLTYETISKDALAGEKWIQVYKSVNHILNAEESSLTFD